MAVNNAQNSQQNRTSTYDPSNTYSWANAGARAGGANLEKYGIDYSQEDQDRIANIFKNQANAAYGAAQNQYSQDIANQQATLSDTIRRSQAEAVATGASRGLQAANELSSILGLQQAAAQGATQIQGDYAQQLAAAQEQAANFQNQRNQVLSQFATADLEAEAQKYAANMDFAANDFNRILSEIQDTKTGGNSSLADAMLRSYLAANGMSTEDIDAVLADWNSSSVAQQDWTPGGNGLLNGATAQTQHGNHTDVNFGDLEKGKTESGNISFTINGEKISTYIEWSGSKPDSTTSATLSKLAGGSPTRGNIVYYNGSLYIYSGTGWHAGVGRGVGGSSAASGTASTSGSTYAEFMDALKTGKINKKT